MLKFEFNLIFNIRRSQSLSVMKCTCSLIPSADNSEIDGLRSIWQQNMLNFFDLHMLQSADKTGTLKCATDQNLSSSLCVHHPNQYVLTWKK